MTHDANQQLLKWMRHAYMAISHDDEEKVSEHLAHASEAYDLYERLTQGFPLMSDPDQVNDTSTPEQTPTHHYIGCDACGGKASEGCDMCRGHSGWQPKEHGA